MAEHLDTYQFAVRTAYPLVDYGAVYGADLVEIEFACEHYDVGPLRVKSDGLYIGDVALRGDVHLNPLAAGNHYRGDVGGYDGRDAAFAHGTAYLAALLQLVVIDYGVDGKIGLDTRGIARGGDVAQVVEREIGRRTRTHVQTLHPEIYRVGTGIDCGMQRLEAAHRRHYLKIFSIHTHYFYMPKDYISA